MPSEMLPSRTEYSSQIIFFWLFKFLNGLVEGNLMGNEKKRKENRNKKQNSVLHWQMHLTEEVFKLSMSFEHIAGSQEAKEKREIVQLNFCS